jgi:hypothetical protein
MSASLTNMNASRRNWLLLLTVCAVVASLPLQLAAQVAAPAVQIEDDPDLDLDPLQTDFMVITMPTTLRVPRHKSSFRVTHRFGRPLAAGTFGELAADLFGLDSGAQIGMEYRYGLLRGTQIGINRTSNRTIEFFAQQDIVQERDGHPVSLAIIGAVDGTNNFRDEYTPSVGLVMSRKVGRVATVYLQPVWVANSNLSTSALADDDHSFLLGVGTRVRVRPTVYLVAEFIPRVAGYEPGVHQAAFGIEKRAGGHTFQIDFSNGFGTTRGQIARGGTGNEDWYLGFHISRKFF